MGYSIEFIGWGFFDLGFLPKRTLRTRCPEVAEAPGSSLWSRPWRGMLLDSHFCDGLRSFLILFQSADIEHVLLLCFCCYHEASCYPGTGPRRIRCRAWGRGLGCSAGLWVVLGFGASLCFKQVLPLMLLRTYHASMLVSLLAFPGRGVLNSLCFADRSCDVAASRTAATLTVGHSFFLAGV